MWNKLRKLVRSENGFTLVEIIVMVAVASIGILATLAVASVTLQTSGNNERRVAGANLAREGIELVRAARDSNWAAYSRQQEAGVGAMLLQPWDCFVTSQTHAASVNTTTLKPDCDGQFRNNTVVRSYQAHPNVGNGVPYFVQRVVNTTKDALYIICPGTGSAPPVFTPTTLANPNGACANGELPFYRRITVQRGKDLGGGNYNILVKSYVNWPGRDGGDLVIEEYLTDWRKF